MKATFRVPYGRVGSRHAVCGAGRLREDLRAVSGGWRGAWSCSCFREAAWQDRAAEQYNNTVVLCGMRNAELLDGGVQSGKGGGGKSGRVLQLRANPATPESMSTGACACACPCACGGMDQWLTAR